MLLTRSLRRRIVVAAGAALGFVLLYESPILDSEYIPSAFRRTRAEVTPSVQPDPQDVAPPAPGLRLRFRATAYCKGTTTASGAGIQTGIAAADPDLLPVGSVIRVESLGQRYNGIYTILDTGPRVKGRQIDIYMWSCNEALSFGRRTTALQVMRLGWNPRTSTPERVGTEFRRREAQIENEAGAAAAPPASRPPGTSPGASSPPTGPATPAPPAPATPRSARPVLQP
jgi:3D (Asp-Asp-Asp) domain-containing protein